MLAVELIESDAQFDGIRAVWEDLQARSASDNVFLTFDWARSWYRHLRAGRRLALLVLRDETGVRAIVPWCTGHAWGGRIPFRTMQFLGTGLSDRSDLLTTADPVEVLEATVRHFEVNSIRWDMIDLREVPAESPTVDALRTVAARLGIECRIDEDSKCPYFPIESDWEKFFSSRMAPDHRRQIGRKVRRILGKGALFSILDAIPEGSPLLGQLTAIPQDEYVGQQRNSIFSSASKRAFFEEIVARFSKRRWLHVGLLEMKNEPVAYRLSFLYQNKYCDYFTGFHRDLARLSPGSVLLTHIMEDCFRRGLREVDFLRGTEGWKSTWTDRYRRQVRIRLYRPGLRGRLIRVMDDAKRWFERREAARARPQTPAPSPEIQD